MKIKISISVTQNEKTSRYAQTFDSEKHRDSTLIVAINNFRKWIKNILSEYPDLQFEERDLREYMED